MMNRTFWRSWISGWVSNHNTLTLKIGIRLFIAHWLFSKIFITFGYFCDQLFWKIRSTKEIQYYNPTISRLKGTSKIRLFSTFLGFHNLEFRQPFIYNKITRGSLSFVLVLLTPWEVKKSIWGIWRWWWVWQKLN